ncbi:hypothetical protein LguiA_028426 [Lonicera macranthoides]
MSEPPVLLKKPKIEKEEGGSNSNEVEAKATTTEDNNGGGGGAQYDREEQEEALVALIEHRTKEVENLRQRMTYYQTQVFCGYANLLGCALNVIYVYIEAFLCFFVKTITSD